MKIIALSLFINFIFCDYKIDNSSSKVKYYGVHPLHEWSGTSSSIIISTNCNEKNTICDLIFKVPIISLNSGNDNRDSNMLKHLNAFTYPEIILEKKNVEIKEYSNSNIDCSLTINGKTKKTSIPLTVKKTTSTKYVISSRFNISLSDYEIELPKLLFIPIEDKININVRLTVED